MKRVLLLLAEGFEIYETSVFIDVIGWNLTAGNDQTELFTCGLKKEIKNTFNQTLIVDYLMDDKHPKPNGFKKFILKLFVKNMVVSEKPYKKNGQTAPEFFIKDTKNFDTEKKRLVDHIIKTQQLGEKHFDGKKSHSFGTLTKNEWNNMFYKHLDHHFNQFGV